MLIKRRRIKELFIELKRTQKRLKKLNISLTQLDQILFNSKCVRDCTGLDFKGEYSNTKIVFIKSDPISCFVTSSPILVKEKFVISSIEPKNIEKFVMTEYKIGLCSYNFANNKFGEKLGLGSGSSDAKEGYLVVKYAATRSAMKFFMTY